MSKITVGMLRKVAACTSQIAVAASYCANAGAVAALHCANAGALAASYCANAGALAASYCANAGAVAAFTPSTARNRNFANPGELWLPIPSIYAVFSAFSDLEILPHVSNGPGFLRWVRCSHRSIPSTFNQPI